MRTGFYRLIVGTVVIAAAVSSVHAQVQRRPLQRQPAQAQPTQRQPVQGQPVQRQPVQRQPVQGQPRQGTTGQPVRTAPGRQVRPGGAVQRTPAPQRTPTGRPAGPVAVARRPVPGPNPLQPSWAPVAPDHAKYVNQLLTYWDHRSKQLQRFRCSFKRWEYDPVFGPRDTFSRYAEGQIKYAAPDKALYQVTRLLHYQAKPGEKPQYVALPNSPGEHWVCDGKTLFELDHGKREMIARKLPPQAAGRALARGPLPFLFGAKKDDILQRYWVRVITPRDVKGEYWLEAYPKSREDASSFKMVHIILDEKDFLPKGLVIFDRNYSPQTPARSTFKFEKREVNWNLLLDQIKLFHRNFYEPRLPKGWKRVDLNAQ